MILVYLPNSATRTAIQAAHAVKRFIDEGDGVIECPACYSDNVFISRKSTLNSCWMELECICGGCLNHFPVPEEAVKGFWRKDEDNASETKTAICPLELASEVA